MPGPRCPRSCQVRGRAPLIPRAGSAVRSQYPRCAGCVSQPPKGVLLALPDHSRLSGDASRCATGIQPERRLSGRARRALAEAVPEPSRGVRAVVHEALGDKAMREVPFAGSVIRPVRAAGGGAGSGARAGAQRPRHGLPHFGVGCRGARCGGDRRRRGRKRRRGYLGRGVERRRPAVGRARRAGPCAGDRVRGRAAPRGRARLRARPLRRPLHGHTQPWGSASRTGRARSASAGA